MGHKVLYELKVIYNEYISETLKKQQKKLLNMYLKRCHVLIFISTGFFDPSFISASGFIFLP